MRTRIWRACRVVALVVLAGGAWLRAQERSDTLPPGKNPHLGDKTSIRGGMLLYRTRCGDCHGLDASGYRGPDLKTLMGTDVADERLFQTIRKGVPGTEMPPSNAPDPEVLMIIAYLRDLGTVAPPDKPTGNLENGSKVFLARCASCHRVAAKGGRLGPDLTRIGIARSRPALVREIRTPSEWIPPGFETVTLVTKDGQRIRGLKKNEDVFSIQIMDAKEQIRGYLRSTLQEVVEEKTSLMPPFGQDRLSDGDLDDLVGYLSTLRGANLSVR